MRTENDSKKWKIQPIPLGFILCLCCIPISAQSPSQYRGYFIDETSSQLPPQQDYPWLRGQAVGDLDGDGDLDFLVANAQNLPSGSIGSVGIFINDGAGFFEDQSLQRIPPVVVSAQDVEVGDFDGDGHLDIFVACGIWPNPHEPLRNLMLINDGTGHFADETDLRLPIHLLNQSGGIAVGDVDGDGDVDIFVANAWSPTSSPDNKLLVNDGTGVFSDETDTQLPFQRHHSSGTAKFGDVDNDGDLDVAIASLHQPALLYLNDGVGFFSDVSSTHLRNINKTTNLEFIDVEMDGDLDIVAARHGTRVSEVYQNFILMNSGNGRFGIDNTGRLPAIRDLTFDVSVGDVDGDGDTDIYFSNQGPGFVQRLYINDGLGYFSDESYLRFQDAIFENTGHGYFFDADGDEDLDLLQSLGGSQLFVNVTVSAEEFFDRSAAIVYRLAQNLVEVHFINQQTANALMSLLDAATANFERGNGNAFCAQMGGFIDRVKSFQQSGSRAANEVQALIDGAQSFKDEFCS